MKLLHCIVFFFLLFTAVGNSAEINKSTQNWFTLKTRYVMSLQSENRGVRNSAIFMVLKLKKAYPEQDYKIFVNELKKINRDDAGMLNRVHASMALVCLERPELLTVIDPYQYEDSAKFFNDLSDLLTDNYYSYK